jgi:hypothetical protein
MTKINKLLKEINSNLEIVDRYKIKERPLLREYTDKEIIKNYRKQYYDELEILANNNYFAIAAIVAKMNKQENTATKMLEREVNYLKKRGKFYTAAGVVDRINGTEKEWCGSSHYNNSISINNFLYKNSSNQNIEKITNDIYKKVMICAEKEMYFGDASEYAEKLGLYEKSVDYLVKFAERKDNEESFKEHMYIEAANMAFKHNINDQAIKYYSLGKSYHKASVVAYINNDIKLAKELYKKGEKYLDENETDEFMYVHIYYKKYYDYSAAKKSAELLNLKKDVTKYQKRLNTIDYDKSPDRQRELTKEEKEELYWDNILFGDRI